MSNSQDGGWWGWIAKTSENVVNIYKEEIKEFSDQIATDTKVAAAKAVTDPKLHTVSAGIANLLGLSESDASSSSSSDSTTKILLNRFDASVKQLQEDTHTYTTDITKDETEAFATWIHKFDLSKKTEDISSLLSSNEKVRTIHSACVPSKVSYSDFWKRYFFRMDRLIEKEHRRAAVLERAAKPKDEELKWDDDDEIAREIEERSKALQQQQLSSNDQPQPAQTANAHLSVPENANETASTTSSVGVRTSTTAAAPIIIEKPVQPAVAQTVPSAVPAAPKSSAALVSTITPAPAPVPPAAVPVPTVSSSTTIVQQPPPQPAVAAPIITAAITSPTLSNQPAFPVPVVSAPATPPNVSRVQQVASVSPAPVSWPSSPAIASPSTTEMVSEPKKSATAPTSNDKKQTTEEDDSWADWN